MRLTMLSLVVRRSIVALMAVITLYILYLVSAPQIRNLYLTAFPPKDLPNPIYGKLEMPAFSQVQISNSSPEYVLNTKTGGLTGNFPKKLTVYKFVPPPFSYIAGKNAQKDASILGYTDKDLTSDLKGSVYTWEDKEFGGRLSIKINSREVSLVTMLEDKGALFDSGKINSKSAQQAAISLISSLGRFEDKLYASGKQKVYAGKYSGNSIVPANAEREIQVARVDFFREISSKNYPILGPNPKVGLMQVYVAAALPEDTKLKFPIVEAYYWEIDPQSNATYPIVSVETAWTQVSTGKGFIANITPKDASPFSKYTTTKVDKILINDIYIGYFDHPKLQTYLQPMYVFEGNYVSTGGNGGSVTVYYPAIEPVYLNQTQNNLSGQE